ncbi:MAG TPA: kelch repeat-containing protein, partial [Kofleriaceae bacterium]
GYVVYREALGERTSIIEQARPDGIEDFFYFPERPAAEALAFDVDLEAGVGGLRLVANTLEILDAAGVPRLRVNPPIAVGANGAAIAAKLAIAGCAVDTSPAIPSRVRTPAGARSCELHLSWSGVTYPALVDPSWVATGSMAFARPYPASSLVIDDHHVLVTGGFNAATGALNSAEVWDASTGVWTVTGSMTDRRYIHQQVLLGTGKVLVTGGADGVAPYVAASEEYDPFTGTWSHRAVMANARADFPLVVVGGVPVVLGGFGPTGPLAACEKYDAAAHAWSPFASMATPRGGAAAASNGPNAFIVTGGQNNTGWLATTELYSVAAGTFWAGAPMVHKRAYHTANPVTGNPRVLVAGGSDSTGYLKTAEAYFGSFVFPQPGSWSAVSDMSLPRIRHQAVNLSPGRVMVCGGMQTTAGANTKTCETFDTFPFTWSADCDMTMPRDGFTMLTVPSLTKELAAGGRTLSSADLSCHHDKCTNGLPLVSTSSACISSICSSDPFCCSTAWDGLCIQEVRTICGSLTCVESEGSCPHPLCTPGIALTSGCDGTTAGCAASICTADPFCCTTAWDSLCVSEVASVCGKNCN